MVELLQNTGLSKLLYEKLKSRLLWRSVLFAVVFFHIFTWSFPYPSDAEAEIYLKGVRGEVHEGGWIIVTRVVDAMFSFGYAKFAFVLVWLSCVLLLYGAMVRLANEYLAIGGALILSANSFLFTNMHRTQPEAVIALMFLACVYLYVRFSTYWHVDLNKSASVTTFGILGLAFCMLNTDLRSVCLIPSLALMVYFVQLRIYKPARAFLATTTLGVALAIVQWLVAPDIYALFGGVIEAVARAKFDGALIDALRTTYTDGYASSLWRNLYKNVDFLRLDEAIHRGREMYMLIIVSAILTGLFILKVGRLINSQRTKVDMMAMVYSPHVPLVLIFGLAFLLTTVLQIGVGGTSATYLFFQVFVLILLCLSIYAFFLRSTRGGMLVASEPRWSELVFRPIAAVASMVACIFGLINAFYYVAPYRGSNYPALYDALQRRWDGTGCVRLAYAPPLYAVALASKQSPPAKGIDELYSALEEGRPLAEGCVVLPLIAKDGVYAYSPAAASIPRHLEQMRSLYYKPVAQVALPFYQKDPAYPVTAAVGMNAYKHAHGDPIYGFGGMEEMTIYRVEADD